MKPPATNIVLNSKVRYGVSRKVPAEDANGRPCFIALVLIEHENGFKETLAIPEALITYAGEGIIADEVRRVSSH